MRNMVVARWGIRIPEGSEIGVEVGKKVSKGESVAVRRLGEVKNYDLSIILSKLPKQRVEEIGEKWNNKKIKCNEVIYEISGLAPKRIVSPIDGIFLGIDEFFNLRIQEISDKKNELMTPVSGKVVKVTKDKVLVEFKANRFEGKPIVEGKVWGISNLKPTESLSDIKYDLEGMVMMINSLNLAKIIKSEVMGLGGIVTVGDMSTDFGRMEVTMPILKLDDKVWEGLVKEGEKLNKQLSVLLNSKMGRLLVLEGE